MIRQQMKRTISLVCCKSILTTYLLCNNNALLCNWVLWQLARRSKLWLIM